MGLEGAVRLGLRKELEAIEDEAEREQRVRDAHRRRRRRTRKALNAAQLFEIDDVIDPADTRAADRRDAAAATPPARGAGTPPLRRHLVRPGSNPLTGGTATSRPSGTRAA